MKNYNIVLFTELNSPYGGEFLKRIKELNVGSVLLVTRKNVLCNYYLHDSKQVNVADIAKSFSIDYVQTENINSQNFLNKLSSFDPSLIIAANYQKKISNNLTKLAKIDAINFHVSPLPKYAGLAPFFWMAKNGEKYAGVSCCKINDLIDGGDIIEQIKINLTGDESQLEIRKILFENAYKLFDLIVNNFIYDISKINYRQQNEQERTYYTKPTINDMTLNWFDSVEKNLRTIRACSPFPGAFGILNGKVIRITEAHKFSNSNKEIMIAESFYFNNLPVIKVKDGYILITQISAYH